MRIPIMNLDTIGIVSDTSEYDLPLNAWSSGRNVRFIDGRTEKIRGHVEAFTLSTVAKFILSAKGSIGNYWLYPGDVNAYIYGNGATYNVTPLVPFASNGNTWTGGVLHGIPVLNTPTDYPVELIPGTIDGTTKLTILRNWPATWKCKSLRPFGNFLVALAVSDSGVPNPHKVNWSHPADPGLPPGSWAEADPTSDSGFAPLSETKGELVDQCTMAGVNIIYKEDSAYVMQHIGGVNIFGFRRILGDNAGLRMPNGIQAFGENGSKHVVFGLNDIYVHDGRTQQSIFRNRMRSWLFNNLDGEFVKNAYIAHNLEHQEMWICFPSVGSSYPTLALIWNYATNTTTIRELPATGVPFMASGPVTTPDASGGDLWDGDEATWQDDDSPWGFASYSPDDYKLLMAAGDLKALVADVGHTFNGTAYTTYVERLGLTVAGMDEKTNKPIHDINMTKIVTEVWPLLEGDRGTIVDVYVGVQEARDDGPEWHGPYPYEIGGTDKKVCPYVSGKILSFRFASNATTSWSLHGYDIEIIPGGR